MDDDGVHDENLLGHRCRVEALQGALVDLPEIGRIEAQCDPDRGCNARSRARNRVFGGNPHPEIRDRAPRNAPWSRRQGFPSETAAMPGMRLPCR